MAAYVFHASTFVAKRPEDLQPVLACPTVGRLLFPARMHTAPRTSIGLGSSKDFDVAQVPKAYYSSDGTLVNIPLHGENGLDFSSTIQLHQVRGTRFSNVVNLEFTRDHLDTGIVTLADLKALLVEVIPAFKADQAAVYHQKWLEVPNPSGGSALDIPRRTVRTPDRKAYSAYLEWLSYFGPEALALIGRERFDRLLTCAEKYELHGGIVVILQDEPFDRTNPAHRERLARAEAELGLAELVRA